MSSINQQLINLQQQANQIERQFKRNPAAIQTSLQFVVTEIEVSLFAGWLGLINAGLV